MGISNRVMQKAIREQMRTGRLPDLQGPRTEQCLAAECRDTVEVCRGQHRCEGPRRRSPYA